MIGTLDVVYITLDHALVGLDAATGALAHGNKLTRFPLTSGVVYGKHLIFGAKGGQVVWQQYVIGYFWMANELGGIIDQPPILIQSEDGATIAAASSSGQVAAEIDAGATSSQRASASKHGSVADIKA